jgi:PAS domain S-box-containing protein
MSIPNRWLKAALVFMAAALLAGIGWYYQMQKQQILQNILSNFETILRPQIDMIEQWRAMRLNETSVAMIRQYYSPMAERWLLNPPEAKEIEALTSRLRATQMQFQFKDVLFVKHSGELYLRLMDQAGGLPDLSRKALAEAFRTKKSVLTDPYLSSSNGSVQIDQVVPFFIHEGNTEKPSGAVIYQYDALPLLNSIAAVSSSPDSSTEIFLIRRDGDSALYLSKLRHKQDAALRFRTPLDRKDELAVKAVLGQRGLVQGKDYRNFQAIAVVEQAQKTNWLIIAKIDKNEAFSALRREIFLILATLFLLTTACFAIIAVFRSFREKSSSMQSTEIQAELRIRDQRYQSILDGILEGCQIIDYEWRYLFVNAIAARHSGHVKTALINHTIMELYPDFIKHPLYSAFQRCMNERKSQYFETELDNPDGTSAWYAFSIQPIPEGIFVLSSDIGDRKKAEAENDRLVSAIEQSSEIVMIFDAEGHIQYVNHAFEVITGYSKEEVLGQYAPAVISGTQDESFYQNLINTIRSGKQWRGHYISRKKDGSLYTEEAIVWPLFNDSGAIISFVSVKRDITEYQNLQAEKEKLQSQLLQSQKLESIGRLAGGVAHDFNNMLSVILGHAQMSLDTISPSHPLFNALQEINKAASRSAELTNQLLAFARKQTISPKVLNLNDAVGGLLNMMQRIVHEGIHLAWMPGYKVWSVKIDPSQINQVLANLVINARDAIRTNGRITIETGNAAFDTSYCADHPDCVPGEYVLLALSDDGCGMNKDILEHIFEPFFTTKASGEGTGLGLATVYGIVKQNEGFINVYSEPGRGSTFKIYLPRYQGQECTEEEEAQTEPAKSRGETVLLVEDEPAVKILAKLMLEKLGYGVVSAVTPSEALRLVESHNGNIHLMIVDVVMPEMTGRELSERILGLRPSLKVLFMSGYTANVIAHHGILDKNVHFIQKPFSSKELAVKVREALE